jgi:signal transduction histidine kinase
MKKWCLLPLIFLSYLSTAQKTDSLLHVLKSARADTQKVNVLNDLGFAYWIGGDDSLAIVYSDQALTLAKKLRFLSGESKARFHLTRIELDRFTNVEPAYAQLDTLLKTALRTNDKKMEGMVYVRQAQFYIDVMNKKKLVNPLFDKALKLFEEIENKGWQGIVYKEKAQNLAVEGKFSDAIVLLLKACKLLEEAQDTKTLRNATANLGAFYTAMGLYPEALHAFRDVEAGAKSSGDSIMVAFVYNQKSEIFDKQGHYKEALLELTKAVKIHEASQAPYWLARTYARMGKEYLKLKDYDNSLKYTTMADKLFTGASSVETLDHYVQYNFAEIYLYKKEYQKVINYATRGLEWAMDSEPPLLRESADYHRQLYTAYEALGKTSQALFHHKLYKTQSDSVLNKEAVQRVTAAALTYTFDKKQQLDKLAIETLENRNLTLIRNFLIGLLVLILAVVIVILWYNRKLVGKNKELLTKNREIGEALFNGQKMERKRVASELHDNLNTKLAALRWRMEAVDVNRYETGDQKIHMGSLEMLDDIYDDVRLISHSMLPAELESEGLVAAFHKLIGKLNINSKTEFQLVVDDSIQRPPASVEHQFYIMTLELINNVLKHAQASKVWISLGRSDAGLELKVSDNGVGTDFASSSGMGMRNLSNRVEMLGGKLNIESTPGKGTTLTIEVTEQ